jgi:histone deacetylase 1/2
LNVHGGQQQFGVNYFETYSPVVAWFSLRTLLTLALLNVWHTRQIDFVQAYPQAPIEFDMYMELPKGVEMADGSRKTHVLKLLKNLYGQKQAGRVWNLHLIKGLSKIGFRQSEIDECVSFYRDQTIFVVYVDDGIFASPNSKDIDQAIEDL